MQRARDAGMIFVAAAGNDGPSNDGQPANYPASFDHDHIISVCAINSTGLTTSFSNYGSLAVDICAPGAKIVSTYLNNTYYIMSGTSMAAPHVAGAVTLMWSREPSLTYN
jgi:subtilisin family serine protease